MESKTLATVFIVIICILLFPVAVGIVGGVFGLIGGILGGIFGVVGSVFGAVFWVIASVFGALFGVIGWLFGGHHNWSCSLGFFDSNLVVAAVIVLVVLAMARSKKTETRGPRP